MSSLKKFFGAKADAEPATNVVADSPKSDPSVSNTTLAGTVITSDVEKGKELQPAAEAIDYPHGLKLILLMIALLLTNLLVALDQTIVAAALSTIANDFHALSDVGWSIICAAAHESSTFIVGRAIAGAGFGGLYIGVLAITAASFPLERQADFISIIGAIYGLGATTGPVPIGGATMGIILLFLNPPVKKQSLAAIDRLKRVDWLGTAFLLGSVICLLLSLQDGGVNNPWNSSKIIGLLVGFGVLMICFFGVQYWMKEDASINLRILRKRSMAFSSALNVAVGTAYFSNLYFVPIYFQAVRGSSAIRSGVETLALIIGIIFMIIVAGSIVTKFGSFNVQMLLGIAMASIGTGLISTFDANTPQPKWVGYQLLAGFGIGLTAMMPYMCSQIILKPEEREAGATIAIFAQTLGATIFVSGSQAIYQNKLRNGILLIPGLDVEAVLGSGVSAFREIVPSNLLPAVIDVAVKALSDVFLAVAIIAAFGFFMALGVEWKRLTPGEKVDMAVA
ncbi:hypothetical protein MNV49_005888 [Pseudohyphozyma bogoriensis]|nr:hypothetical protein MNV49_005888 [Pseudohyphozyma bogoriensis]